MITIYVLPVKLQQAKETLTVNDSNIDSFQCPIQPTELTGLDHPIIFIELYHLYLPTATVRYAACDVDIVFGGNTYKSLPIQRGEIKATVDNKVDTVELKIANVDQNFTTALYQGLDFRGSRVEIFTIIYPDSLNDSTLYKYIFTGYLDNPVFDGKEFKVTLKNRLPNSDYPPRTCDLLCQAWFGDADECGAAKNTATVVIGANSTQTTIYSSSIVQPTDHWKDGMVTWQGESRQIISSGVGFVRVRYPLTYTVSVGSTVYLEQGCDHFSNTCRDRYGNLHNYSGFLAVPFELKVVT